MRWAISPPAKRIIFLAGSAGVALYFVYLVRAILSPFVLATIGAYLLSPLVEKLQKWGVGRVPAILLLYLSGIILTYLIIIYGFPVLIEELNFFADTIPKYAARVQHLIGEFYRHYQRIFIPGSIRQVTDETLLNLQYMLVEEVRSIAFGLISLFSQLFNIVLAPVLAFYILKDAENIRRRLLSVVPLAWRADVVALVSEVDLVLTKFVKGHLLVSFLVGLFTAIGLAIVDVPFALILGIIAGLADLIPYFGPIIGAVPAIAVALLDSGRQAVYVLIIMLIVQQLEANVLSPRILGTSVGLHPLVVVFVLLAGGQLLGIIGMLVAVPITAVVRIFVNYCFNRIVSQ